MTSVFTGVQPSSACNRDPEALDDSERILYFTCKLLNSTPHFLSSIDYDNVDLGFRVSPQKIQYTCKPGYLSFTSMANPASSRHVADLHVFEEN
jgi:hypothetical protein